MLTSDGAKNFSSIKIPKVNWKKHNVSICCMDSKSVHSAISHSVFCLSAKTRMCNRSQHSLRCFSKNEVIFFLWMLNLSFFLRRKKITSVVFWIRPTDWQLTSCHSFKNGWYEIAKKRIRSKILILGKQLYPSSVAEPWGIRKALIKSFLNDW